MPLPAQLPGRPKGMAAVGLFCREYPSMDITTVARMLGRARTEKEHRHYIRKNLLK